MRGCATLILPPPEAPAPRPKPRPCFNFAPEPVITGFNTDVPFEGVTYHVQTEDKGLETPLILSLVYVGGAIIASKRTPYEDLISKGFDEQTLTERLQRQHKLIIAAIKNGRVEDLKRMGGPTGVLPEAEAQAGANTAQGKKPGGQRKKKSEQVAEELTAPPAAETVSEPAAEAVSETAEASAPAPAPAVEAQPKPETIKEPAPEEKEPAPKEPAPPAKSEPEIVILASLADEIAAFEDFMPRVEAKPPAPTAAAHTEAAAPPASVLPAEVIEPEQPLSNELYLTLLDDEGEFRAGQLATVKVYVGRGAYGQRPEAEAAVTVKVLGTAFRPLILSTETDALGVGVVRALLPRFTSGRAAIIIRASAGEDFAEMRRIIHQ